MKGAPVPVGTAARWSCLAAAPVRNPGGQRSRGRLSGDQLGAGDRLGVALADGVRVTRVRLVAAGHDDAAGRSSSRSSSVPGVCPTSAARASRGRCAARRRQALRHGLASWLAVCLLACKRVDPSPGEPMAPRSDPPHSSEPAADAGLAPDRPFIEVSRVRAYGRIVDVVREIGAAKLHAAEIELVRGAADARLFAADLDEEEARERWPRRTRSRASSWPASAGRASAPRAWCTTSAPAARTRCPRCARPRSSSLHVPVRPAASRAWPRSVTRGVPPTPRVTSARRAGRRSLLRRPARRAHDPPPASPPLVLPARYRVCTYARTTTCSGAEAESAGAACLRSSAVHGAIGSVMGPLELGVPGLRAPASSTRSAAGAPLQPQRGEPRMTPRRRRD